MRTSTLLAVILLENLVTSHGGQGRRGFPTKVGDGSGTWTGVDENMSREVRGREVEE